jgi:hypothetical protein
MTVVGVGSSTRQPRSVRIEKDPELLASCQFIIASEKIRRRAESA